MRRVLHGVLQLLLALVVLAVLLVWRLVQGPLDVTWLVRLEQWRLPASLQVGGVTLAWQTSALGGASLDLRASDVELSSSGRFPRVQMREALVELPIGQLLLGRISPRNVTADGLVLHVLRRADGTPAQDTDAKPARLTLWPPRLRHLGLTGATILLHDAALGLEASAHGLDLDATRQDDGAVTGELRADVLAGTVPATLAMHATPHDHATHITASLTPINPAALARLSPALSPLAALDAPVTLSAEAELDGTLVPASARLEIAAGPGTLSAGRGSAGLSEVRATLRATHDTLTLDDARIAFARLPGAAAPPPTFKLSAAATRATGRVHASFAVDEDSLEMADLGRYWPEGTGGGARPWLVQNVTAGRVRSGHVAGTLEATPDLADVTLTGLSGGAALDEATLWWLRPVPPVVHAAGKLVIEGPDSLRVTLDRGSQDRLVLASGSGIHITKLEEPHQFGDIAVGLSGPLSDALALLDHPRLKLLSRGNVAVVDPAGEVSARMTLHVPLENHVTMDDIPVAANATLTGVHLGGVVGGRDLDDGALSLKITGDGLDLGGTAAVAGIPANLALHMDFRAGPPDQVLQHLTASGHATGAQLIGAGVPLAVSSIITDGAAGMRVDYAGHRDGAASIQVAADLGAVALATPLGWSKPVGPPASASGRVLLDHGRLAGVEDLRATGPGLSIASRAQFAPGQPRVLLLDRLQLGQTDAHGRIAFAGGPAAPLNIHVSGPMLDLSTYLATPSPKPPSNKPGTRGTPTPDAAEAAKDEAPGPPWSLTLAFDRVQLARGEMAAPFTVDAASDGARILHAAAVAGTAGEFNAQVTPDGAGRRVAIEAADSGLVLRAAGVAENLRGGSLKLDARYDDSQAGSPLAGTATLDQFQLTQAPAIGRLLQAMTLYGLTDALRGPGLHFSHLVAPFRWHRRVLHLAGARAFSPSLGLTAQGDIDLRQHTADITGTVVPAYFFNQLLGDLPLIGRIFSPEKGGGVFAARYSVRGKLADPVIGINPLAALTPGFLREGFGLFSPDSKPDRTP